MSLSRLSLDPDFMHPHDALPDLPRALLGTRFEPSYTKDAAIHARNLRTGPCRAKDLLYELAERAEAFATGGAVFCFGGGRVSEAEKAHAKWVTGAVIGRVGGSQGRKLVSSGGGPGVMAAAHEGAREAVNGQVFNLGLAMPGLFVVEKPEDHNDDITTVADMSWRLQLFLRLAQGGIIKEGGPGTWEEIAATLGLLVDPRNQGLFYPVCLSEVKMGEDTAMSQAFRFLVEAIGVENVGPYFTLQQGDDEGPLEVFRGIPSTPNGHWHGDLHFPREVFTPFQLTPERLREIELLEGLDDPLRFLGALRDFFHLIVEFTAMGGLRKYREAHETPVIRVSQKLRGPLELILDRMTQEERIKSSVGWREFLRFQVVR